MFGERNSLETCGQSVLPTDVTIDNSEDIMALGAACQRSCRETRM